MWHVPRLPGRVNGAVSRRIVPTIRIIGVARTDPSVTYEHLTVTPTEAAAWIPLAPVIVTWLDHTSRTGWNAGNLVAPARVTEVGYVYKETEEFLILVHGYDLDDHDTLSASAIPLGCIEKVVTLRVA